jgi:heptosyltransferase I
MIMFAPMIPYKNICILRMSAIGDVTHVLSLVQALQSVSPNTAITWIIGSLEHKLLKGLPGVEFIVFDKKSGLSGLLDLRKTLAGRSFDALLHMQVAFRANLVSTCIKAKRRIGYDSARSKDLHGLFINQRIASKAQQHVMDCLASFLQPLGIESQAAKWQIPLSPQDLAFAEHHIDPDHPTLVISPCSSHPLRNWQPERYAAVADYALGEKGFQVLLAGGPSQFEQDFGHQITTAMQHEVENLIGKDTLKQGAALMGGADLVIAPDTGPAHIANAMGTAVIGLYAASNPRRSGPYDNLDLCVDKYDQAARKFRQKPASELKWGYKLEYPGVMDLIEVADVTARIDQWCSASA